MRVRDRRALPREAACFRDGQIDVGRSAFVCTGGAESELEKGGNTSKATCPDTKKTTTIVDTRIRVHTNVSQSAEVKPTFYRRPLDSGMHVLRRIGLASSSSCAMRSSYLQALLVGLAGLKDTVA